MTRLLNMYKVIDSIPGIKYKADGGGNVWGGIDRSNNSYTDIFNPMGKLEWILSHQYVLKDMEKRILNK